MPATMVRIIGGTAKGRRLLTAKGLTIRPTPDRVKESLFNIIGENIVGAEFLDLFAGTGSIGLEALSRGAQHGVFVEKNAHHVEILRKNLEHCKFSQNAEVYREDALKFLRRISRLRRGEDPTRSEARIKSFDIIFADPPYGNPRLAQDTLRILDSLDLLARGGQIIIEHSKRAALPEVLSRMILFRQKYFGDTVLSFYREKLHEEAQAWSA
jgi:16S rRNA (guanine(966)-N(2))-methyltransferase RsmD